MGIFDAIMQGIVQGAAEFLPISSSGHLSLYQHFTGNSGETGVVFSVLLHFGTLAATVIAFRKTIWELIKEFFRAIADIFRGKFSFKNMPPMRRMICLIAVSLIPLLLSLPLRDYIEGLSMDDSILVEGICFLITSALLFMSDRVRKGKTNASNMNYRNAATIGVAQVLATMPGISRSGSTISTGLMVGLSREFAVEYSFILGLPAVLGGTIITIPDAIEEGAASGWGAMAVGMLFALIVGLLAIRAVKWLVNKNKFKIFAYYTLVIGIISTAIGIYELISGNKVTIG